MNVTLTMNDYSFSNKNQDPVRVSTCEVSRPRPRGLDRTRGNIRLSAPSRLLSDAGNDFNDFNSKNKPIRRKSRRNSLEEFIQGGMAALQQLDIDKSNEQPPQQIQELRASLAKKCEESRRRISAGNLRRDSFQCRSSDCSSVASSSIRSSIFGGSSSLRNSGSMMMIPAASNNHMMLPEQLRESIMGTTSTLAAAASPTMLQRCTSYDIDGEDIEEQRRQLELFNNLVCEDCEDCEEGTQCLACAPDPDESFGSVSQEQHLAQQQQQQQPDQGEEECEEEEYCDLKEIDDGEILIEVAPGVRMSLKTPEATWSAVLEGRITVTACTTCGCELTCADDAQVVICTDCWVFSPVDQSIITRTSISSSEWLQEESALSSLHSPEGRGDSISTVGSIDIGIKTEDIFEWLESQDDGSVGTIPEE
jgi:hypothetical protein